MRQTNRVKRWYSNLHLHNKISFTMIIVLVLLSLALSTFMTTFFIARYTKESMIVAEQWLDLSTRTINQEIAAITDAVVSSSVKPGFVSLAFRSLDAEERELQVLVEVQTYLEAIMQSSPLIDAALIVDRNNHAYTTYSRIPKYNLALLDYDELSAQGSFVALSSRQSPFSVKGRVIPFLVPLNFLGSSSYLEVSRDQQADLIIVILLDESALYNKLNEAQSLFFRHVNTLEFDGQPLLERVDYDDHTEEGSIYWRQATSLENLSLVMIIERASFKPMLLFILLVCIASALLIATLGSLVIVAITGRITKDFTTMTGMIEQIKESRYQLDVLPRHNDETGALIGGINEMYRTLLLQMEQIKREEEEKYRYHSQMLTEQINPHFIYNTLEIINMEVHKEQYERASNMIQAFAAFLRYSLNQGEDTTTLDREVDHIRKYLMIMNTRLDAHIILTCDFSPSLGEYRIPKSILLPLVENSIRHGFSSNMTDFELLPVITIRARRDGDRVTLEVVDNGRGIDIAQAKAALTEGPSEAGHVGLHNIHQRLKLYYGRVEVEFSSIPGYRNEVIIVLDDPVYP